MRLLPSLIYEPQIISSAPQAFQLVLRQRHYSTKGTIVSLEFKNSSAPKKGLIHFSAFGSNLNKLRRAQSDLIKDYRHQKVYFRLGET